MYVFVSVSQILNFFSLGCSDRTHLPAHAHSILTAVLHLAAC